MIFAQGIRDGIASAIRIKLSQIGTVTETLETVAMAWEAGVCQCNADYRRQDVSALPPI